MKNLFKWFNKRKQKQTKSWEINSNPQDLVLFIQNLNIYLIKNRKNIIHIIKNLNLEIKKNFFVCLVGESGSGKSLTAKTILGINFTSEIKVDKFLYKNIDLNLIKTEKKWQKIRGKEIGYIPQDSFNSLNPLLKLKNQFLEVLKYDFRFKNNQEKLDYIINIIKFLGIENIENYLNEYPESLSGGMKQRIVIALSVSLQPSLIIADEPTTALDEESQNLVISLLKKIQKEYKISILFISHNQTLVEKYADYIYVIKSGQIINKINNKVIKTRRDKNEK